MAARYQHVTDPIRRDVANRIGASCGQAPKVATMPTEPRIEPIGRGSATRRDPRCRRRLQHQRNLTALHQMRGRSQPLRARPDYYHRQIRRSLLGHPLTLPQSYRRASMYYRASRIDKRQCVVNNWST